MSKGIEQTPWRWSTDEETLGKILASLRAARRMTQTALARKLGVSNANLSRIEHGADLRVSTLIDIARVLGFEPMLVPKEYVPTIRAILDGARRSGEEEIPEAPRFS